MSFHFQPQADSSDEEEAVDIAAWKSGVPKPAPAQPPSSPTAAIEIMDELANEIDNEDGGEMASFQGDLNGDSSENADKKDGQVPFISSGFTFVNKPAPVQAPISLLDSEDEQPSPGQMKLPTRTRRGTSKPATTQKKGSRVLVPVIPRIELDSSEADEIIDFTAGNDVVRRVLKERKGRDGDIVYKVEFEDRHVEEVSLFWFYDSRALSFSADILARCIRSMGITTPRSSCHGFIRLHERCLFSLPLTLL
jgi:hypothetical protein